MGDDGTGARLDRLRGGGAWRSLLSAQEFAALESVGFDPVGDVLGTVVAHTGYVSAGGKCTSASYASAATDLASAMGGKFNALLRKRSGVRRRAISRAIAECVAADGDGVVGMKLTVTPFPAGGTEYTVRGTAVRARTALRPAAPFASHISGQEFAMLLRAGWVPSGLVIGIALGARHDDQRTKSQARLLAASREITGYSHLVRDTRRDARKQLEKAAADCGGDGIVVDRITLRIGERECPSSEGAHDHVCEAVVLGTAIVPFTRTEQDRGSAPLAIMHLNPRSAGDPGLSMTHLPDDPERDEPETEPGGGHLDRFIAARAAARASGSPLSSGDAAFRPRRMDNDE
jgi:uncharacterized protein YbjQ (UPF0145 family)